MSTQQARPVPAVRIVNAAHRCAALLGWEPFKLEKAVLRKQAIRQAGGLTDFGDPRHEEGLEVLLHSLNGESNLNGFGRLMASQHIVKLLKQRLLITEHLKRHPEILDEKITQPIFIIGSARTGTTITHHLLSQDERMRYPFTWECEEMYPPLNPATMRSDPRVARSQKECDLAKKMAPDIEAAHPIGAWEAQECALFMALEFTSKTFMAMFNCHQYNDWLYRQDLGWVYDRHKIILQYMQSGGLRPRSSWLLKTPPHMSQIDAILNTYPDARFITTYREPTEVVVSASSLCSIVASMAVSDLDLVDLGAHLYTDVKRDMLINVEQRKRHADKADQFIDLAMLDVVKQPLHAVKQIYRKFAIDMPDAVLQKMERYIAEHALERRKQHVYRASDYGLDVERMWHDFDFYREFYHINSNRKQEN